MSSEDQANTTAAPPPPDGSFPEVDANSPAPTPEEQLRTAMDFFAQWRAPEDLQRIWAEQFDERAQQFSQEYFASLRKHVQGLYTKTGGGQLQDAVDEPAPAAAPEAKPPDALLLEELLAHCASLDSADKVKEWWGTRWESLRYQLKGTGKLFGNLRTAARERFAELGGEGTLPEPKGHFIKPPPEKDSTTGTHQPDLVPPNKSETAQMAVDLAKKTRQVARLKRQKADSATDFNDRIKQLEAEIAELAQSVDNNADSLL